MEDRFAVNSITGTAITLNLAGPGARSYAFILDLHFRFLIAAALFLILWTLAANVRLDAAGGLVTWMPWTSLAVYLLYHPLLEILMRGSTPGKRIAGIRIVDREGGEPGIGALIIRNVLRLVDSLPGIYLVGLVCTMLTRDRVRIGDLAAGTLLVYDTVAAELMAPAPGNRIDPAQAELVRELLARWDTLTPAARQALAERLLSRLGIQPPVGAVGRLRPMLAALLKPPT